MKKQKNSNIAKCSNKSIFEKITTVFLWLLLTIFLFGTGESGFVDIQTLKYKLFLWICGGYVVTSFLFLFEGMLIGAIKVPSLKESLRSVTMLQKCVLIHLIITWISAVVSEYFPETVIGATRHEGALTITIYGLCFLLVSRCGTINKSLVWLLCGALFLFGVICVLHLNDINALDLYPEGYKYSDAYKAYSGAYVGTIGNVDLVASFLCLAIPMLIVMVIRISTPAKYLVLIPLAVIFYVLIKMNVLAGIVGVFVGLILLIPIVCPTSRKTRLIYMASVFVTGICGLTALYFFDLKFELLHQIHEMMHGNISETFGSGRIYIWKSVMQDVPNHFLFGSGPDTMVYAGIEPFKRYDQTLNSMIVSGIDIAHNEYLNVLSQQGIFAFISYVFLVIYAIFKWIKAPVGNLYVKILGSALLCYFIQAFFSFSMCITAPFFWVTLGLFDKSLKGEEQICGRK